MRLLWHIAMLNAPLSETIATSVRKDQLPTTNTYVMARPPEARSEGKLHDPAIHASAVQDFDMDGRLGGRP
jgi:hypothetical protein